MRLWINLAILFSLSVVIATDVGSTEAPNGSNTTIAPPEQSTTSESVISANTTLSTGSTAGDTTTPATTEEPTTTTEAPIDYTTMIISNSFEPMNAKLILQHAVVLNQQIVDLTNEINNAKNGVNPDNSPLFAQLNDILANLTIQQTTLNNYRTQLTELSDTQNSIDNDVDYYNSVYTCFAQSSCVTDTTTSAEPTSPLPTNPTGTCDAKNLTATSDKNSYSSENVTHVDGCDVTIIGDQQNTIFANINTCKISPSGVQYCDCEKCMYSGDYCEVELDSPCKARQQKLCGEKDKKPYGKCFPSSCTDTCYQCDCVQPDTENPLRCIKPDGVYDTYTATTQPSTTCAPMTTTALLSTSTIAASTDSTISTITTNESTSTSVATSTNTSPAKLDTSTSGRPTSLSVFKSSEMAAASAAKKTASKKSKIATKPKAPKVKKASMVRFKFEARVYTMPIQPVAKKASPKKTAKPVAKKAAKPAAKKATPKKKSAAKKASTKKK
ncbi:unnamed protein product [Caenorhabditis bovis]|uniref:EGF-like domain-containing protein n=1 Tax=Caenorhabditis bovis TaxID=2654633 RepID=A0A8S1EVP7_9PELO|nr:unnamed protein product [Caenorhabditis bovis]